MTISEAEKIGWRSLLKGTLVVLAVLVALLLIGETKGDFANGILFFLAAIISVNTLLILLILFGLTYFFSKKAVNDILIAKKNNLLVALKYATLITLAICLYELTIFFLRLNDISFGGVEKIVKLFFIGMFFKTGFFLCIVWLWATNKIKSLIITDELDAASV